MEPEMFASSRMPNWTSPTESSLAEMYTMGVLLPELPSARSLIGTVEEEVLNQADIVNAVLLPTIVPTLMRSSIPSRSSDPLTWPATWSPEIILPLDVPWRGQEMLFPLFHPVS